MLRAFNFEFKDLHERMRRLVRQRNSDAASTPDGVTATITPSVFFTATRDIGVNTVVDTSMEARIYCSAKQLDCIFPPTAEDLATDDVTHPYYGHRIKSRWYDQYFDLDRRSKDAQGESVAWASHQKVDDDLGVCLRYSMKTFKLKVDCYWAGSHKRPNRVNEWVQGTVNWIPYVKKLKKEERDFEDPDNFRIFIP